MSMYASPEEYGLADLLCCAASREVQDNEIVFAGTGLPMIHWVQQLAARAQHVVAVGSCAAWGGITAGGDNPTDACGLQYEDDRPGGLLGADFRLRKSLSFSGQME